MEAIDNIKKNLFVRRITLSIALLGLLTCFFACKNKENKGDEVHNADSASIINVHENNSAVNTFIAFVKEDSNEMALDHTYTSDAVNKLAEAVGGLATEIGYDIREDLDRAKECAAKITKDPNATTHADDIRKATDILSASLKNMQMAKYPQLSDEANALKDASATINPDVLTLNQKFAILSFFSKAADLLQKMN